MERIKFFREFDNNEYVSENGNITIQIMGKLYIYIYIHERGKEFMTLKKNLSYTFEDIGVTTSSEIMKRLRYVYYEDDHRHVLSLNNYGTLIEFYHDSEMYRNLKM